MYNVIIMSTPIDRTVYFEQIKYRNFRSVLKMYTRLHNGFHKVSFIIDWIDTSSKAII